MSTTRLRFSVLLAALVGLLLVYPLVADASGGAGLGVSMSLVVLGVVRAIPRENIRDQATALVLAAAHLVPVWAWTSGAPAPFLHVGLAAAVLFYGHAAVAVLLHLAPAQRVTSEELAGAASVYLLLGVAWAVAYAFIDILQPGAFAFPPLSDGVETRTGPAPHHIADYLYVSLVTLTTLGFGDVLPTTRAARSLVVAEAVTGVFYTTVVLARLVSVFAATSGADAWSTRGDTEQERGHGSPDRSGSAPRGTSTA
ncbi:MAG: ion channel [Bacteroidota bacterium]